MLDTLGLERYHYISILGEADIFSEYFSCCTNFIVRESSKKPQFLIECSVVQPLRRCRIRKCFLAIR